MTNPNDAESMLLRRAQSQLLKWAEKYGENNPSWLPPTGDVRLIEDMAEFIATSNVQAEEVPATFIQERAQLDHEWTALRELTRHCREAMKEAPGHPAQGDAELSDEAALMQMVDDLVVSWVEDGDTSSSTNARIVARARLESTIHVVLQSPASVDAQRWMLIESFCGDREIREMVEAFTSLIAYQCQVPFYEIKDATHLQHLDRAIAAQAALKEGKS